MKRLGLLRCVAACTMVLLACHAAPAAPIAWTEQWQAVTRFAPAAGTGAGGVELIADSRPESLVNSSQIVAASLWTLSNAPAAAPQVLHDVPYHLQVVIRDSASGVKGMLSFEGLLNGTLSQSASSIHNRFVSPQSQTLHLGHDLYTVTLDHFTPPGPPDSANPGSIGADVFVRHNPEPTSLVLLALGLPALFLAGRRYRRKPEQPVACA